MAKSKTLLSFTVCSKYCSSAAAVATETAAEDPSPDPVGIFESTEMFKGLLGFPNAENIFLATERLAENILSSESTFEDKPLDDIEVSSFSESVRVTDALLSIDAATAYDPWTTKCSPVMIILPGALAMIRPFVK